MYTTEEKVSLLKKMQKRLLDNTLNDYDMMELDRCGLVMSFMEMDDSKQPQDITQFDIVEEER